ncbi:alkaline phosphatase family protein [Microbulbifer salipaludis]|nr:alkaline phosphatase family protein [Microbulbifer salipaludis]
MHPVVALGLDSADSVAIERWVESGELPNIAKIYHAGKYCALRNYDWYRAETPWTTFLTGASPAATGYWSPIKYDASTYKTKLIHSFDFKKYRPFYAKMPGKKVAVFDMPQTAIDQSVDGIQVLAWGTHSGQTASVSEPPQLWDDIVQKYGPHPLLNNDGGNCYNYARMLQLFEDMKTGIQRRADACVDLIKNKQWDFFLTIFGESHVAGHYFWHLGNSHPINDFLMETAPRNLLLEAFKEIDTAIGRILEVMPRNARLMLFSAHGMGPNTMDLPSIVFLPEFLYRWNFPGKKAIGGVSPKLNKRSITQDFQKKYGMAGALWSTTKERGWLKNWIKRLVAPNTYRKIESHLSLNTLSDSILGPALLRESGRDEPFQCPNWYENLRPEMKAFSLPSFSEGYIRINLKGRDRNGIVSPDEYEELCNELIRELSELKDVATQAKLVDRVVKTRSNPEDTDPNLPDADLVVIWNEDVVSNHVACASIGEIGPVPFWRTGSHRANGFAVLYGDNTDDVAFRDSGHVIDLGETFITLVNGTPSGDTEGVSLVSTSAAAATAE